MRRRALAACAALALLGAYGPARAEYAIYQGEVLLASGHDPCSRVAGGTTFSITVNGRDDAPLERIDGYLSGDKIVPARLHGADIGRLTVSFPGETASTHTMKLRRTGPGAFEGQLPVKTLTQLFAGCDFASAQIRFSLTASSAQAAYEQALQLFAMDARSVQAYAQGMRGSVRQGLAVLQAGLEAKRKIYGASHPQLLPYEFFLAALEEASGDFPAQVPLYRAALEACTGAYTADSACAALALTSLSGALLESGAFAEAESTARGAIAICDRIFGAGDPLSGIALDALAAVLIETGRYGEADTTLTRALEYNRKVYGPDSGRVGLTLTNRSVLARYTGQYREAESSMRQALAIDSKTLGADSPLAIINTIDLGQILRVAGRGAEAEPLCRQALEAARRVLGPERPDHPSLGMALICVAEILRESGRFAEAEPLYRQALDNDVKYLGPDHPSVAVVNWMLAKLLRATARDADARAALDSAYRIAEASGNAMLRWRIAAELMLLYGSGTPRRPAVAIFYGKQAVNDLQRLRGGLNASDARAQQAFVAAAEVHSVYTSLADLLVADGRIAEGQQVLAMLKEHELYDFTRDSAESDPRRTVVTFSTPEQQLESLSSREVALGQEYGELQAKFRRDHALGSADRARLEVLRKSLDASRAAFEARVTEVALSANDPEAQRRRRQQITDFGRSFQGTLQQLGHAAVLAQYFILDDKVEILLTTPDATVARESAIKRADLDEQILQFRQTLGNPGADPLPQAQALYRLLVAPIAGDLRQAGAKTLMLSLDDTLRYLPFAALHDGTHYLIEDLSIAIATEAVRDKLGRQPLAVWSVWGLGVTKPHAGAAPLPWAGVELNDIAGPKGVLGGKVLLDAAFNEQSLRDGLDQGFPIIHIASHFRFAPGSMDDSVLLMGDGSLLTLAQIRDKLTFSGVDLLTLSACETALGDDGPAHHGIEVEGLGAIAQQAGAGAVLATLWSVADTSTALLMRTLYQAHRDQHLTKAEALRAAQLALLHGSVKADSTSAGARGLARMSAAADTRSYRADPRAPFAHPYFWAPFILMGNWL